MHMEVKNESPDMILTPFDRKFDEKKDELPPGACRPPNKLKKTMSKQWALKKLKKNNVEKVGPIKLKKQMSKKWVHICLYTFIYLDVPSYTSK